MQFSSPYCDFDDCRDRNKDTSYVVRDSSGIKVVCEEHWRVLNQLFEMVSKCFRNGYGCWRNHGADLYPDERNSKSVRYMDKYWELCDTHVQLYQRFMAVWLE